MNTKQIILSASGLALAGALLAPSPSHAEWHRVSAGACGASDGSNGSIGSLDTSHDLSPELGYIVENDSINISCPLYDASGFQKQDIDRVNVHTYDQTGAGNNYGRAYICAADPFAFVSACLASQSAGGSGFKTLTLSTPSEIGWIQSPFRAGFFATVRVFMTSNSVNDQRFIGYWVTD
ncbi:MAG: hypothetical protein AAF721_25520 [Myxococcota bacterium]